MADFSEMFMKAFVEVVSEMAAIKGLKKGAFAQKVWPETSPKLAREKWLHIRTITPRTGQPQGVLISDALRMAEALGEELAFLMLRAKDLTLKKQKEMEAASGEDQRAGAKKRK
jgi:hypothetical protein